MKKLKNELQKITALNVKAVQRGATSLCMYDERPSKETPLWREKAATHSTAGGLCLLKVRTVFSPKHASNPPLFMNQTLSLSSVNFH